MWVPQQPYSAVSSAIADEEEDSLPPPLDEDELWMAVLSADDVSTMSSLLLAVSFALLMESALDEELAAELAAEFDCSAAVADELDECC